MRGKGKPCFSSKICLMGSLSILPSISNRCINLKPQSRRKEKRDQGGRRGGREDDIRVVGALGSRRGWEMTGAQVLEESAVSTLFTILWVSGRSRVRG
jgi:hypothetical protein